MVTLFWMSLIGLALFFASVPVMLFALMLETCAERAARSAGAEHRVASTTPKGFDFNLEISQAPQSA